MRPPTAAKAGSVQGATLHVVACPVGFVPDTGSAGAASATDVTPGPTIMPCNSEMTGSLQSQWPAKHGSPPRVPFKRGRKSVKAAPSGAVPVNPELATGTGSTRRADRHTWGGWPRSRQHKSARRPQ